VVHWFDFFGARCYEDTIYGCTMTGTLPTGCTITDVQLEILDGRGQSLSPRQMRRFNEGPAIYGGTSAIISAAPALGRDLRVKVISCHDFGWAVRYRLIYTIRGDNCSLPPFRFCDGGDAYGIGVGIIGD
jgi:hypothetical protein